MATEKKVVIDITLDGAAESEKKLSRMNKLLGATGKVGKKFGKAGVSAIKGIGTAIGATGILAILKLLWETVQKNQVIMDLFNRATVMLNAVLGPLVNGIADVVSKVSEATGGFEGLKGVLGGAFGTILNSIKTSFFGIKLAIEEVMLGYYKVKSAFTDVDQTTFDNLNASISETKQSLADAASATADSFGDIIDNAGKAFDEVSQLSKGVSETISNTIKETNLSAINEQAKAIVEAEKQLQRLQTTQDAIKESYETQAESLRQVRDDESALIEDRKKANIDLGKLLEEQHTKELDVINKKIAAAEIIASQDTQNIEYQTQLNELRNERLELENRITGQQSEQLTNINALNKEESDYHEQAMERRQEVEDYIAERTATEEEKKIAEEEAKAEALIKEIEDLKINEDEKTTLLEQIVNERNNRINAIRASGSAVKEKIEDDELKSKVSSLNSGFDATKDVLGKESTVGKAAALGKATVNTFTGISEILKQPSTLPSPFDFLVKAANATAIGVMGFKQVAAIKSTKFANGGIVPGTSFTGDRIDANVNSGEMILNREQQAKLFNMANGGAGAGNVSDERIAEVAAKVVNSIPVYVVENEITETQRKVSVKENIINNQ